MNPEQAKKNRKTAWLLLAVAIGFYLAFFWAVSHKAVAP
jgi:hypothetical protein